MTQDQIMNKMRASAIEFRRLTREQQYVRAINLYYRVHAVAMYIELPQDMLTELFGSYADDVKVERGLFDKETVISIADRAMKQEIEENRRGNPTQIQDFRTYLPRSYFKAKQ